jgi:hypothetical protein
MNKLILSLFLAALLAIAQQPVTRAVICTDAGASGAYTCSPTAALSSYVTGQRVQLFANTINTGAATVNISSLGAKTIKKRVGGVTTDLDYGDIRAGAYVDLIYDGTNFQLLSEVGNYQTQYFRWTLDGGGSVLSTATSSALKVDKACIIREALLDADQSGSLTVTVEKATYTTGTPTYSTISSSFLLSSARSLKDTTLASWTTSVAADDLLRINITGTPATITKATVLLRCF